MNDLPRGWTLVTLGDVITPRRRKAMPHELGAIPFVGMDHIEAHTSRLLGTQPVSEMKSAVATFEKGDILYGRLRPYLNKVYEAQFRGAASAEFIVFPHSEVIHHRYLAALLRHPRFVEYAALKSTGDRPRVNFDAISGYKFPLPPASEQIRIVSALEQLGQRTHRARAELGRIPLLVQHYRSGILLRAFRGLLTSPNVVLDSSDSGQLSPLDLSSQVPAHWSVRRLDEIAEIQGGLTLGKKRKKKDRLVEVPYLRVANVQRGRLELDEVKTLLATPIEIEKLRLRENDILMNEGGDRDKLGRGWVWDGSIDPCIHQNHVFRVRLTDPTFPAIYVSLYANEFAQSYFFSEGTQTTNLASISKSKISALPVPIPPREEAVQIVGLLQQAFIDLDDLSTSLQEAQQLLDRQDQEILSKAFRGELAPQDPNDEPASALLERTARGHEEEPDVPLKASRRKRTSETTKRQEKGKAMAKNRSEVSDSYLSDTLRDIGGKAEAHMLWQKSDMDIDEFYKLLRDEIDSGRIKEGAKKERLVIANAA